MYSPDRSDAAAWRQCFLTSDAKGRAMRQAETAADTGSEFGVIKGELHGAYIVASTPSKGPHRMKSVEEYAAAYGDIVQKEVPNEQVLVVGVLSRPGSIGAALLTQVSGLAALAKNKSGKTASADLPLNVVAAATPTRVLFFAFKPRMMSIKLKGLAREIPRAGLSISVEPGTAATRVTFHCGDGSAFQLDSNRSIGQYNKMNDGLLAELGR